jgi:hypothetical protein
LILKLIPEMKKFIKYNNIDHDAIRQSSNYIELVKVPKGGYIFKQGDPSDNFYCILRGKVSIRSQQKIKKLSSEIFSKTFFLKFRKT